MSVLRRLVAAATATTTPFALVANSPAHAEEPIWTPAPGGVVEPVGAPLTAVNIRTASTGTLPDGRAVIYAPTFGEPAELSVVDAESGQIISSHELAGKTTAIYTGVAPDQSAAYVAGQTPGANLFRYDTATGAFRDLGSPVAGETNISRLTTFDTDNNLYTGTFPNGHVVKYDPAADSFEDWGPIAEGEQYARSTALWGDKLYVGTGTNARFFQIDINTRQKVEIPLPEEFAGQQTYVNEMYARDGLIFAFLSPAYVYLVYDTVTGQWLEPIRDVAALAVTESSDGSVYVLKKDNNLWGYDTAAHTISQATTNNWYTATRARGIGLANLRDPAWPGTTVVGIGQDGRVWHWNPTTRVHRSFVSQAVGGALKIAALGFSPDRTLYATGFLTPGLTGQINPDTLAYKTLRGPQQAEFLGSVATAGGPAKFYMGTYIDAGTWQLDESRPFVWGTNPQRILRLDDRGQERVATVVSASTNIAIGTIADKGDPNGALTLVNPDNGSVHYFGHPVPDHSIVSLLYQRVGPRAVMIGGTSTYQLGVTPEDPSAKLFVFDILARTTHAVSVPAPGATSINQIVQLPDGRIWALANDSSIHEVKVQHSYDPAEPFTMTTTKVLDVFGRPRGAGAWSSAKLQVLDDRTLLGSAAGEVFTLDIASLAVTVVAKGSDAVVDPAGNGSFFFSDVTKVYRYTPERVAPQTTATVAGNVFVNIALAATDDRSGVQRIEYRVNGDGWTTYTGSFVVMRAPQARVQYRAVDTSGNVEQTRTLVLHAGEPLDTQVPPSDEPVTLP